MASSSAAVHRVVSRAEITSFMCRCMEVVGVKLAHAQTLAETLEMADHRGHYSHGLNRLEIYIKDVQSGVTAKDGEPTIERQTVAIAHVNGQNLLGPVVGRFCMDLAISKAKEVGIGMVVANNSNHFGIAGAYGLQAVSKGMLGLSFTNTSPLVNPTRSKTPAIGTNPICFAAPSSQEDDPFVLDMATSAVALGKIEFQNRKGEPIPEGWGADSAGNVTTSGQEVTEGGGLLPLGGIENLGGYKGYGLAMMVDVLCGILGNAKYGPNVRKWKTTAEVANLGQCFIAIDPEAFGPGFQDRMSDVMASFRGLEPTSTDKPVMVAGDPEREHMAQCEQLGGIRYHINQIEHLNEISKQLNVESVKVL